MGIYDPKLARKCFRIYGLDLRNFVLRQLGKLVLSTALRQRAVILVQETEQQIGRAVRHIYDVCHFAPENVVGPEEGGLSRQIDLNGPLDTLVEKLRMRRCVEEAIEVRRLIQNLDVTALVGSHWISGSRRAE